MRLGRKAHSCWMVGKEFWHRQSGWRLVRSTPCWSSFGAHCRYPFSTTTLPAEIVLHSHPFSADFAAPGKQHKHRHTICSIFDALLSLIIGSKLPERALFPKSEWNHQNSSCINSATNSCNYTQLARSLQQQLHKLLWQDSQEKTFCSSTCNLWFVCWYTLYSHSLPGFQVLQSMDLKTETSSKVYSQRPTFLSVPLDNKLLLSKWKRSWIFICRFSENRNIDKVERMPSDMFSFFGTMQIWLGQSVHLPELCGRRRARDISDPVNTTKQALFYFEFIEHIHHLRSDFQKVLFYFVLKPVLFAGWFPEHEF